MLFFSYRHVLTFFYMEGILTIDISVLFFIVLIIYPSSNPRLLDSTNSFPMKISTFIIILKREFDPMLLTKLLLKVNSWLKTSKNI